MEKVEGNLKQLRKKFETSIDREIIESVFSSVDENYNKAHEILLDMLKTTANYSTAIESTNKERENGAYGIWTKPNNIRNVAVVNGNPAKLLINNSPKRRNPSKKELAIIDTIQQIKKGFKVMVLLRGMPGSGKSYMAKQIVKEAYDTDNFSDYIFSADDFFSRCGQYRYVREQVSEAHAWNQSRVHRNVRYGLSPVIVDNTNVKIWEMKVYVQLAIEYGYYIHVLEPATLWAFNHHELAKRNVHDVPRDKIREMLHNYETNVTTAKLLVTFGLAYSSSMRPPQLRLRPSLDIEEIENIAVKGVRVADDASGTASGPVTDCNSLIDLNTIPLPPASLLPQISRPSTSRKPILNTENNLFAWGLTENVINSWNMVETIQDDIDINKPCTSSHTHPNETRVQFRDDATNTCSRDFAMAEAEMEDNDGHIINAIGRDITKDISLPMTPQRKSGNRIATFEKGIMTMSEIDNIGVDTSESDLATLRSLFMDIPVEYLRDVYEKCHRNANWAVDLLLDDNREILKTIPSVSTARGNDTSPQNSITANLNVDDDSISDNETVSNVKTNALDFVEVISLLDTSGMSDYEPTPKQNKLSMDTIKKHIENMVQIGNEFYSDHVFNVKSLREGTSSLYANGTPSNAHNKINNDVNMNIDDFEMDQVMKTVPPVMDGYEEFVELNLGDGLVRQLESQFRDAHLIYPDGLLPTIQVPVSFARQLHAFYLESIFEQLDNQQALYEELCKEDEAYATKLQEEENLKLQKMRERQQKEERVPQLAEIMQEQAAHKDYYQSKLSADDLASRLTRQKLFDNFPSVSEDTMLEIFAAHNNNYVKTVQVLLNTGLTIVNADEFTLRPPVEEQIVTEMKQAEENLKKNKQQHDMEIVYSADEYRKLALRHGARRNELMSQAQEYHRKGMGAVAMFYSRLAREESDLYDQTNARAAESFLQEHNSRLDKFDTIDLHYLQAKEVCPALDIFLDRHINLLHGPSSKRSEILYIITGRGKHSRGGLSVIKPIVVARLGKRQIGYNLMNPGLLQITVSHNSPITSDLR